MLQALQECLIFEHEQHTQTEHWFKRIWSKCWAVCCLIWPEKNQSICLQM